MPVQKVAVFDLNKTLYNKSSKDEFYFFILKKKKHKIFQFFSQLFYKLLKYLHLINKTEFKENFFNYLDHIPPKQVEEYANEFWSKEFPQNFNEELLDRVKELQQQGVKVLIVSGGLEVYIKSLSNYLKIDEIIGTKTIYKNDTYQVKGKACKDYEKIKQLKKSVDGKFRLIESYSDSKEPILFEAEKSFFVKNGKITLIK